MSLCVKVNGEDRDVPLGATVATIVELFSATSNGRGVAVALDGEVVPRASWSQTELADGAQVEVVAAVQGG
jgi:sulfur carrier protein